MNDLLARRYFLQQSSHGLGAMALAALSNRDALGDHPPIVHPMAPKSPHFPAQAKNVIMLFMAGGPSHVDLLDYKPKLQESSGQPVPESFIKNRRFAFLKGVPNLQGSPRKFAKYGKGGAEISQNLPHLATIADDVTIVRSMFTDAFNHGPAKMLINTGSQIMGRPGIGAWVTYAIGSESADLPGYVVLQSGGRGPRGGAANWAAGFLPTVYQGVPFLGGGNPILNLNNPPNTTNDDQRRFFETVRAVNSVHLEDVGDPEIAARISAYETAGRMQIAAPELIDLTRESHETLALYGAEPGRASFANNCLLARRMVERGVRFVQLFHTDWDHHRDVNASLDSVCRQVDRPAAALVGDLKRRGLLDSTLVLWGGEFGRTPMAQGTGRDHHPYGFSMWLAGGGIRAGFTLGKTDEFGINAVEDPVHVHDLQATVLHLLGLDHTRLTYRFQGRDFRLTDVHGNVVNKLLA